MGSFASSAFSLMLAWVRSAAAWLWQLASGEEASGLFRWIGAHWKGLALALCVVGLVVDWVVYLIRWRPQRVWQSFFRRLRPAGRERAAAASQPEAFGDPSQGLLENEAYDAQVFVPEAEAYVTDVADNGASAWNDNDAPGAAGVEEGMAADSRNEADTDARPRRRRRQA